ncbi:MAG: mandelate racemase/muconate lactonizing enzyme family protein [Bryobacterales bacterium]|nr:mandelate racemase/muconate lactonizing enzyme family protein [Bryobacterales bacterium]
MKIRALETIRLGEFPNLLWVRVHSDEGLIGLGETFMGASVVETYLHDVAAPQLLGEDPLEVERIARSLVGYLGFRSTGAEMRGNSAIDLALWDLWGKSTGQPVYQLLGGAFRRSVRVYNTCAGYRYIRAPGQAVANWGLPEAPELPYEDLDAFLHRAGDLAHSLLEQGVTAMKIWPFDPYAEGSAGLHISPSDLKRALGPFEAIRGAVGDRMDIMVEFHSLWNLPAAIRIARALEPYGTFWHEDPIRMDSLESLRLYAQRSPAPVCASETLGGRAAFRDLLETGAVGIVMLDLGWCGGLTEARAIAAMADAWKLPIAPHDCTGPVVLAASTHLSMHAPNALVQETVRAFYYGWYQDLATDLPPISHGAIRATNAPGFGIDLQPGVSRRPDAVVRWTRA